MSEDFNMAHKDKKPTDIPLKADDVKHPGDEVLKQKAQKQDSPKEVEKLKVRVEELETLLQKEQLKAKDNWDRLLRKEAELQNLHNRSANEIAKVRKYGLDNFANELLVVLDSFDQALHHEENESEEEIAHHAIEGIKLTHKLMLDVMEKFEIKPIDPKGKAFDPKFHEAMSMQETDDIAPNHIVMVIQKGYSIHDRILRPARVIVSKAIEDKSSEKE